MADHRDRASEVLDDRSERDHAYEALFREQFAAMARLAAAQGAVDPDDVAQQAFVRLYGSRRTVPDLRDRRAAVSYLRTAVESLAESAATSPAARRRESGAEGGQPAVQPTRPEPASGDAWRENRRRIEHAARRRRGAGWLIVGLLALLVGGASLVDRLRADDADPGSGRGVDAPFNVGRLITEPVELARLQTGSGPFVTLAALSDTTDFPPALCVQFRYGEWARGGCRSRDARAADPAVAFEWLSAERVPGVHAVVGGVDHRVAVVTAWFADGTSRELPLVPAGAQDASMFALTVRSADPALPQRLVAHGLDGTMLEVVELPERNADWLAPNTACDGAGVAGATSGDGTLIALGTSDAFVEVRLDGGRRSGTCLTGFGSRPLVGWSQAGRLVTVVVGPEVHAVELVDPARSAQDGVVGRATAQPTPGTLWQVATLRVGDVESLEETYLAAVDPLGRRMDLHLLQRATLRR